MITVKDLEAIEKIKAFIVEQGYGEIRVDFFESQRERAPVSLSFRQISSTKGGDHQNSSTPAHGEAPSDEDIPF
jgi:hypothetical protein